MAAQNYRNPAPVEPEPVPAQSEAGRLGTLRSVHAPPPLRRSLIGPVLISGLVVGFGAICQLPMAIVVGVAVVTLAMLVWSPLRTRGKSVELHARGLVLHGPRARSVVAFEDVNETWFEISPLHSQAGAYLRALRLIEYSGHVHSVPIAVNNGAHLATAVLRACSQALLRDAREALVEGQTLTFANVQLDRAGISVDGKRAAWREIRLAVVSHARLHLYGRTPILAWCTVRLDRVPNPVVLAGLVAHRVGKARVDDVLIAPLADESDRNAPLTDAGKTEALKTMLWGGIFCIAGSIVTWATWSSDLQILAWGPIVFGAVRFFQGATALWRSRRP